MVRKNDDKAGGQDSGDSRKDRNAEARFTKDANTHRDNRGNVDLDKVQDRQYRRDK